MASKSEAKIPRKSDDLAPAGPAPSPAPPSGKQQGPAEVVVAAGEQIVRWDNGLPTIFGPKPQLVSVSPVQMFERLHNKKASEFQYLEVQKCDGSVVHAAGPCNRYTLSDGTCPSTGEVVSVKDQFRLPSKSDCIIVNQKEGSEYSARVLWGPKCHMPANNEIVTEFAWTHPNTHAPGAFKFTYLSTATQSMKVIIPDIQIGDDVFQIEVLVAFQIDPDQLVNNVNEDPVMEMIHKCKTDLSRHVAGGGTLPHLQGEAPTKKKEKDPEDVLSPKARDLPGLLGSVLNPIIDPIFVGVSEVLKSLGVLVKSVVVSGTTFVKTVLNVEINALQQGALASKLGLEIQLQGMIAQQELALAGAYAYSQNTIATVQQLVNVETTAMNAMAGMAKGAGSSDKNYSKVAACCCCSIATKTQGGIWASIETAGSITSKYTNNTQTNTGVGVNVTSSGNGNYTGSGSGNLQGSLTVKPTVSTDVSGSSTVNTKTSSATDATATATPAPAPAATPAPAKVDPKVTTTTTTTVSE